jgi:hypothetical protein
LRDNPTPITFNALLVMHLARLWTTLLNNLPAWSNDVGERFLEIRKNGKPVDEIGYPSLGGAALAWEAGDPTGTEVVEVNVSKFLPADLAVTAGATFSHRTNDFVV